MTKKARTLLKKLIKLPFNAIGFDLVRKGSETENRVNSMPSWEERIAHARGLGFSPKVIFDGGAFLGIWAKTAARIFPGAQLVMVEPNPFVQVELANNVSQIQPSPIILNVALGELPGNATLKFWRDTHSDTGASLLNHVSGPAPEVVPVAVDTLDNISQTLAVTPDLVKLDLQGGELAALRGANRVLAQAELMVIEFGCLDAYIGRTTPHDLLQIMYANDYCLYDIIDCHYRPYDGAMTGGDFIFVKNSSILRRYKGWE